MFYTSRGYQLRFFIWVGVRFAHRSLRRTDLIFRRRSGAPGDWCAERTLLTPALSPG